MRFSFKVFVFRQENNDISPNSTHSVENINEFLGYHSRNGVWAEDTLIQLASDLYEIGIFVWNSITDVVALFPKKSTKKGYEI